MFETRVLTRRDDRIEPHGWRVARMGFLGGIPLAIPGATGFALSTTGIAGGVDSPPPSETLLFQIVPGERTVSGTIEDKDGTQKSVFGH